MKILILSLISATSTLILHSCASTEVADSKDVNQETIYQSYHITYNDQSSEITAKAIFRFGGAKGTTLRLTPPAQVLFNQQVLEGRERLLKGYVYQLNMPGSKSNNYSFSYTDLDSNHFTNTSVVHPIIRLVTPDSLAQFQKSLVEVVGEPFDPNEDISINISDINGKREHIRVQMIDQNKFEIPALSLKSLAIGQGFIQLQRDNYHKITQGQPIGGELSTTYLSHKFEVNIGHPKIDTKQI